MTTQERANANRRAARIAGTSERQMAVVAGYGLLLMTLFTLLAEVLVLRDVIVPGDAAATANRIIANQFQFRFGIVCHLVVIICDLIVAWALYVFLKPLNSNLSLLAAWSRLVYSTFYGIALVNYYSVFQLLSGADFLTGFETSQLYAQVMLSINAFRDVWAFGYIFFGLHLAFLGYVVFRSGYIPRFLGVLLIVAGSSYLIDYLGRFLFPNFDAPVALVLGWGEAFLMFWLIFRGGKGQQLATTEVR